MAEPFQKLSTVRPLVRYVDADQAVVDAWVTTGQPWGESPAPPRDALDVLVQIHGADGFYDEARQPLEPTAGPVRLELVQPQRWWPAGMGEQALYRLSVTLLDHRHELDQQQLTLGLTSVRADPGQPSQAHLLVNGQICEIQSVIAVDRVNESQLLPVGGDSLMLVRDHYGPDVLYEAADRAGVLLIQCIPIHADGHPEVDVAQQVHRLAPHPSLAGWFVGHLGRISDDVAARLRDLDPGRHVFRDFPASTHQPAA